MIEEAWAAFNNEDPKRRKDIASASSLLGTNMISMSNKNDADKRVITGFRNFVAWDDEFVSEH